MNKNTMLVLGLVVGLIIGISVDYIMNQSQIAQLQSDLINTQSSLATSQSEVASLQSNLLEVQSNITTLETQLADSKANITLMENQLQAKEAEYSALSEEFKIFKSNISFRVDSLKKKFALEAQIIKMWVHYERGELTQFSTTLYGLEPYVDAIGDLVLSTIWDEFLAHVGAGEYAEADAKLAELMENNSALIQSDLSELDNLLSS
jgi:peptidoglycan hydrolase CwlO-like protein